VIGTEPAIRFQVTLPDTTTVYETKPEQAEKGMEYEPVTLSTGNNPEEVPSDGKPERLFFNIDELQKEHPGRGGGAIWSCARIAPMPTSSAAIRRRLRTRRATWDTTIRILRKCGS